MKRTESHRRYDRKMFDELGVNRSFYQSFIIPGVKRIKGNKCEVCGSTQKLEVHHSSKELINIDTLKLLCHVCHQKEHKS